MNGLHKHCNFSSALALVLLTYVAGAAVTHAAIRSSGAAPAWSAFGPSALALVVGLLCAGTSSLRFPTRARSVTFVASGVLSGVLAGLGATLFALADGHTLEIGSDALAFHAVMVAPITEELLFTGFLYLTLRRRRAVLLSTIVVAAVFTVVHFPSSPSAIAARLAHEAAACMLFELSGTLLISIVQHFLSNLIPYTCAYLLDGGTALVWVSPDWLSGTGYCLLAGTVLAPLVLTMTLDRRKDSQFNEVVRSS